jgi:hypothetical protein
LAQKLLMVAPFAGRQGFQPSQDFVHFRFRISRPKGYPKLPLCGYNLIHVLPTRKVQNGNVGY